MAEACEFELVVAADVAAEVAAAEFDAADAADEAMELADAELKVVVVKLQR